MLGLNNVLVSLVIPIYNAENYLAKCIDSILKQTYKNIEIILINDGSKDNSGLICDEIKAGDSRVKVIHQKNSGPSAARNAGILMSDGKYIQFVDADDHIDNTMVQKLLSVCGNEVDLVLCGNYKNGAESKKNIPDVEGIYTLTDFMTYFQNLFEQHLIHSPGNKLYRTKIIKNNAIKFNVNLKNGEDLLFNIEYIKHCKIISLIKLPLYHYNDLTNPSSLTKGYKENFFESRKVIFKSLSDLLGSYTKEIPQLKELLEVTYSKYLIFSMSNIFHIDSQLNESTKIKHLKKITEDKCVVENIAQIERNKIRGIVIRILIKYKMNFIISLSFNIKLVLKKTQVKLQHLLKKFYDVV